VTSASEDLIKEKAPMHPPLVTGLRPSGVPMVSFRRLIIKPTLTYIIRQCATDTDIAVHVVRC